jgi:hypothetical protein
MFAFLVSAAVAAVVITLLVWGAMDEVDSRK